jgi:hypothetical protein
MQVYFQDLNRRFQEAVSESEGIGILVSFGRGASAEPPLRPVYYNTGLLMLAGSLLGLIVGGIVVQKLPIK